MSMTAAETQAAFKRLGDFIDGLKLDADPKSSQSCLIEVLHHAQKEFGYLPTNVQEFVAERLRLPLAHVYGVITFYHYFSTKPRGDVQINVCLGTACYVRGADSIIARFEERLGIKMGGITPDHRFSLVSLRCVGACSMAPVVTINDKTYGKLTPDMVDGILDTYKKN